MTAVPANLRRDEGGHEQERTSNAEGRAGPLVDLMVIDMASVVAGPAGARYLADFGAEVIKVEGPAGDPARRLGWSLGEDDSFFWKIVARNKKCVTLDLKSSADREAMLELVDSADALVESFRPGTLERLGLDPELLLRRNPRLAILRVTGFGQDGPYSRRPGFATVVEGLTGYAALSGDVGGPPLLPPIALTDELSGIAGAFALMAALWSARRTGIGQVVDVNLAETLLQVMGPLVPAFAHLDYEQPRMGSGLPWTVPRGTYECADGKWVALSASADSAAARLIEAVGLGDDARFSSFRGRMQHREELEGHVRAWIAPRSRQEVLDYFEDRDVAAAPVNTMGEVFADEHFAHRQSFVTVDGIVMPSLIARFSRTPGRIRHAGRPPGADQALVGAYRDRALSARQRIQSGKRAQSQARLSPAEIPLDWLDTFGASLDHPEGIAVTPRGVLYVGGEAGQVYRVDQDGAATEVASTGGFNLGLAADSVGRLYVCDSATRVVWQVDPADGASELFAQGTREHPMRAPNWGAFDAYGNYYVTDSGDWGGLNGVIWVVRPGKEVEIWCEQSKASPNGCALSADGRRLYVVESYPSAIVEIPISLHGSAGERTVLQELGEVVPNGVAVTREDELVIACYRPDAILLWSRSRGLQTLVHDPRGVVLAAPTNIAFVGAELDVFMVPNLGRRYLTRGRLGVNGLPLHYPTPEQLGG